MSKMARIAWGSWWTGIMSLILFPIMLFAAPMVTLRVMPEIDTIDVPTGPQKVIIIARVDMEVAQFAWTLEGPGTLDGDLTSRQVFYAPPSQLSQPIVDVTITVAITDAEGERTQEHLNLTLRTSKPISPAPQTPAITPDPSPTFTPTPTNLTVTEDVNQLLRAADAYFDRTLYTEPEGKNAFSLYREALRIDPANQHAREQIRQMAATYRTWGDNAKEQTQADEARRYYERYLLLIRYMVEELGDQALRPEFEQAQQLVLSGSISTLSPEPSPTPPGEAAQRSGKLYAVIIGVNAYADARLPTRRWAENDARSIAAVLTAPAWGGVPPEQLRLLLGADVTERKIKHAIGTWVSQHARAEDVVVIYFAGQGLYAGNESYWLMHDTEPEDIYATALHQEELREMFDRVPTHNMFLFFDACYDAVPEGQAAIPWATLVGDHRAVISASDGKCPLIEDEQAQHSVFASALLDGLQGQADANADANIELEELWQYLDGHIPTISAGAGSGQIPQRQGAQGANVVLTVDRARLQTHTDEQQYQLKQEQLIAIYRAGDISAEQFTKALNILKNKTQDRLLEDFLAGKISLELFKATF